MSDPNRYYTVDGNTGPLGGVDFASAVEITEPCATWPEIAPERERWWFIHNPDDFPRDVYLDPSWSYDGFTGVPDPGITLELKLDAVTSVPGGAVTAYPLYATVPAGTTYWVRLSTGSLSTRMILAVGDWSPGSGWIQPSDRQIIFRPPNSRSPDFAEVAGWPSDTYYSKFATPDFNTAGGEQGAGFAGEGRLDHSFQNSEYPGQSGAAFDCAWSKARVGNFLTKYWSADGTVSTHGGACVYTDSGANAAAEYVNWPLGTIVKNEKKDATVGGGHQYLDFLTYGVTQVVSISGLLYYIGTTAGADPNTDPDFVAPTGFGYNAYPLFEDPFDAQPELVELEARPSETTNAHHNAGFSGGGTGTQDAHWYWSVYPLDDHRRTDDTWGPKTGDGGFWNDFRGAASPGSSSLPESFVASQEPRMANGVWQTVDGAGALAAEEGTGAETLVFTGLPAEVIESISGAPPDFVILLSDLDVSRYHDTFYDEQVMLLRATLRPGRIRFAGPAVLPVPVEVDLVAVGTPGQVRRRFFDDAPGAS